MNDKNETKEIAKKVVKGTIVVGAGIYTGNLFVCVVPPEQGILAKLVAGVAGTAIGGWLGLEAANGIEYRVTEAMRKLDAKRAAGSVAEVKVNG